MKKIGFKLLLSGVALAACAATLSTTTYAWYVTNSEANASGITGSTAEAGTDGNILVAKNKEGDTTKPGAFSQNISFDGDTTNLTKPANGLNPVSKDTDALKPTATDGATLSGWHAVDLSEVKTEDAYIAFDIWVLSTKVTTVKVELTTTNKTETIKKQTCYNASHAPVAQEAQFAIDAVKALRMGIKQDAADEKVYAVDAISTGYTSPTGFDAPTATTDAQEYYKDLLGEAPKGGATEAAVEATKWESFTVTANTPTKLSFKIWLEGTDKECFDSCAGQNFEFAFKFFVENPTENA